MKRKDRLMIAMIVKIVSRWVMFYFSSNQQYCYDEVEYMGEMTQTDQDALRRMAENEE